VGLRRSIFRNCILPVDGAVLSEASWLLRYLGTDGEDFLLIVNLGRDQVFASVPEPLIAPTSGHTWRLTWSSENPDYGGGGFSEPFTNGVWRLPGHAAIVLAPSEAPVSLPKPAKRRTA
jgi:maltooligosyltrehalose trehalohydrolase